ncbi:MAG TPA: creatininase family protein [Anaerolineales bacterium]|nr:creatininase family protein [Anaerolineales bacterium]
MKRTVQLELLRPEEIIAERERCPVIYVPLGPLEWHSLHLPIGTDPLNAQAVARAAALQTGGVVFPTLFWGTERERPPEKLRNLGLDESDYVVGMDFPGISVSSLYAREEVFGILIKEVLDQLAQLDYPLVVLVNGHGAKNHIEVLRRLSREFTARTSQRVLLTFALPKAALGVAGHAEAVETSVILHAYPDSVDLDALPPVTEPIQISSGIVDSATFAGSPTPDRTLPRESDPRFFASAARGEQLFQQTVTEIVDAVREALKLIRPAE